MDRQLPVGDYITKSQFSPEQIIADWSNAIIKLQKNYTELSSWIKEVAGRNREDKFIGQCPVSQLTNLVARMRVELEKLIQDMGQSGKSERITIQKQYKRLVNHTLILDQLNQQAQLSFHWLNIPAS